MLRNRDNFSSLTAGATGLFALPIAFTSQIIASTVSAIKPMGISHMKNIPMPNGQNPQSPITPIADVRSIKAITPTAAMVVQLILFIVVSFGIYFQLAFLNKKIFTDPNRIVHELRDQSWLDRWFLDALHNHAFHPCLDAS